MGASNSHTKHAESFCNTPPKHPKQILFDPRSPNENIARTPIQIDSQTPISSLKFHNPVIQHKLGRDLSIHEENDENDENNPDENKSEIDHQKLNYQKQQQA